MPQLPISVGNRFTLLRKKNNAAACSVLIARGANLSACDNGGNTPLACAVHHGSIEAARVLLKAGSDPDWRPQGEMKRSLVREAEFNNNFRMLCTLLSYGARPAKDLERDFAHVKPLQAAMHAGDVDRFAHLLNECGPEAMDFLPSMRAHAAKTIAGAEDLLAVMDCRMARQTILRIAEAAARKPAP